MDTNPYFTECMWEAGALRPVISSKEREFSVSILSRIKFAFPRARFPKMPGTRERETRNARPSLSNTMFVNADPYGSG